MGLGTMPTWATLQNIQRLEELILQKEKLIEQLITDSNISALPQDLLTVTTAIQALAAQISNQTTQIANQTEVLVEVGNTIDTVLANQTQCCTLLSNKLDVLTTAVGVNTALLNQIIQLFVPKPAVAFTATITLGTQGEEMAKPTRKIAGDLQVADNGTFTVSLTFTDADGVATGVPAGLSATYTASDATPGPSALTLTPSADTSSCAGSINQTTIQAIVAAGGALPTGLTVGISATWTGLATPATGTAAPPIDVVAGPASTFVASETTP